MKRCCAFSMASFDRALRIDRNMVRPVILARIRANASTAEIEGLRSAVRRARDPEDVAAENQEYEGGHCLDDGGV
jgi:hypothetical protein